MSIASASAIRAEGGYFDGKPHSWMRRQDGTILDATPEQFGWSAAWLLIAPEDEL